MSGLKADAFADVAPAYVPARENHMPTHDPKSVRHVLILPSFYSDPDKPVIGSFFKEQVQALRKAGLQVGVAYVEPRSLRALGVRSLKENYGQITIAEEESVPTMRLHGWNPLLQTWGGGFVWSIATRFLVRRYIEHYGRPDVIHAHNALWGGFASYLVQQRLGIPYVLTEHSGGFLSGEISARSSDVARRVYRHASQVIVVSSALGRSLEGLLDGRSYRVVPNCVDTDYFSLPPAGPPSDGFTWLAVAHLSKNKGLDVLLRAFAKTFRGLPDRRLDLVGDGPIMGELVALSEELGIRGQVRFLGAFSREQVRTAMWGANALVLSSFHETFGVVLIEAMSTGLPVVATRSGGPEDIVTGGSGILVEPGNVEALSAAMNRVTDDGAPSRTASREGARLRYAQDVVAKVLADIYASVGGGP